MELGKTELRKHRRKYRNFGDRRKKNASGIQSISNQKDIIFGQNVNKIQ